MSDFSQPPVLNNKAHPMRARRGAELRQLTAAGYDIARQSAKDNGLDWPMMEAKADV